MTTAVGSLTHRDYFRRLLGALWLKPESALWYAHELHAVNALLGHDFKGPSLEFGCMDGVNTFLLLGGEFEKAFDVYKEVRWTKTSHVWHSLEEDYFNTFDAESSDSSEVRVKPTATFDVGLSWRKAHVVKAARLGVYKEVVEHDYKQPMTMFADGQFETIWAPNLYWVSGLETLLRDLRRTMAPTGRMVTVVPDTIQLSHLFYRFAAQTNPDWLKDLDRGRYANTAQQARTLPEWVDLFAKTGLRIRRREMFLPSLVAKVYDIGFRPMFPVFMNIYDTLKTKCPDELPAIKEHWMETAFHFMAPMCDLEWMDRMPMEKLWHVFELEIIP